MSSRRRNSANLAAQTDFSEIYVLARALADHSRQLNLEDPEKKKLLTILLRKLTRRRKKPMATEKCRVVVEKALAG